MKKTLLLLSALLMVASVASAQQRGSLTLGYDDCRLAGGTASKFFACTANTGSRNLFAAYVAGTGVNELVAWAGGVDIYLNDLTVPAWWAHGAAGCRGTDDLSVQFTTDSPSGGCLNYQGQVSGGALGGSQYDNPNTQANHTRIRFVAAVDLTQVLPPIPPGTEAYLFNVVIRNGNTTVAPICAGCAVPAVLAFTRADLEQRNNDNFSVVYRSPTDPGAELAPANAVATWQTDQVFSDPTPNTKKTWGAIKSIYR